MKTFREFIIEAQGFANMTDYDFDRWVKANPAAAERAKKVRAQQQQVKARTTNVSGQDIRGGKPPTGTPPKTGAIVKSGPSALSTNVRPPVQKIKTNMNVPGGKNVLKGLKGGAVLGGVIDAAGEKASGSGWKRSLAKGLVTGLGTLAGGAAGSAAGPVGTYAGGAAGGMAASKAFDVAAGANAKDRAAMRQQKRQSQAGGALVGTGGKTTFDTKKNTMTTGTGANQKTVRLTKMGTVRDPKTGGLESGYLAYKGGKAVYKRGDTSNAYKAKTSSNALERIGRTINPNAYKASDEAARKAKLQKAVASDNLRNRDLGINRNKVGPKIVGQKIVGPKKVGPAPAKPKK